MDYINAIKINTYEDAVSYISSIPRFADKDDFVKMQTFYDYESYGGLESGHLPCGRNQR